jgi:hypothetical protein
MEGVVVVFCAYCRTVFGQREPLADTRVTHGACDACLAVLLEEVEAIRREAIRKETHQEEASQLATSL